MTKNQKAKNVYARAYYLLGLWQSVKKELKKGAKLDHDSAFLTDALARSLRAVLKLG